MRIRKHAKISPLLYATSSLPPGTFIHTPVCQLNQSPWDVMNFSPPPPSPPPLKVSKNAYSEIINGSSRDSISVVKREKSDDSLEYPNGGSATDKADEREEDKGNNIILCCKTDGKSWRCKKEALSGHSMCEHHLTMSRNYTNSAHSASKKQEIAVEVAERRLRPKKASASSSSNPFEFYYYSGFGPSWGKKRGKVNKDNGHKMSKDPEQEHEKEASMMSQFVEDEFEYSELEDEDKDKENGKKRPRKRIKARSLKSLM